MESMGGGFRPQKIKDAGQFGAGIFLIERDRVIGQGQKLQDVASCRSANLHRAELQANEISQGAVECLQGKNHAGTASAQSTKVKMAFVISHFIRMRGI